MKKDKDKPILSRSDILVMSKIGKDAGVLEENEQKIIQNLLRFAKVLVRDIMTPRIVVVAANADNTARDFHDRHPNLPFSRIPLYQDNNDNVIGYVLRDELLLNLVDDNDHRTLKEIRRDIITVHKTLPIPDLLNIFISKKEHMALVVDEFGGMEGIVTMEDIIETLLGLEIVDESDNAVDMQVLARRNWELRARKLGFITPEQLEAASKRGASGEKQDR